MDRLKILKSRFITNTCAILRRLAESNANGMDVVWQFFTLGISESSEIRVIVLKMYHNTSHASPITY
jgi:hypothetical protein